MAFKPKPNKKIDASPIITLDKTHEDKMKKFHHNESVVIPELEGKCVSWKKMENVLSIKIKFKNLGIKRRNI